MFQSTILKVFAKSPIKPMQEHMQIISECVNNLIPFFESALRSEWETAQSLHDQIMLKESQADDLKKEIRLHLPHSLFLPVSRGDLLGLLTTQDKIASKAKHISGMVLSRKMKFPEQISVNICTFVARSIAACTLACKAINELEELVETGFKGKEVEVVETMIVELNDIERDTDDMQYNLRSKLFSIEKSLDPVDVIFQYKIIDWIAELADRAQHAGNRLESLLAH